LAWDDQQVQQAIQDDLRAMLGLEAKPIAISVSRWPKSMAQYETGHAGKLSKIEDRLSQYPLLFLAGNGYRGIGISDCIKSGRAAVPIS
jgi:oxygen-dependent protoporphyrinogen oxidase